MIRVGHLITETQNIEGDIYCIQLATDWVSNSGNGFGGNMKTYSGISKKDFVAEMHLHAELDNFIKGTYGQGGTKGCAIGCGLKSLNKLKDIDVDTSDHSQFEKHGLYPEWLARLEDTLFEGVSDERSKTWPVKFTKAMPDGVEFEKLDQQVKIPFIVFILESNIENQTRLLEKVTDENIKAVVQQSIAVNKQMIAAQKSGDKVKIEDARSAAESAAESAVWSAESAVWSAARSAAYEKYANELLRLLRKCK